MKYPIGIIMYMALLLIMPTGLLVGEGEAEAGAPSIWEAGSGIAGLPITRVVLFTSGVGYYQRDGQVEGDTSLELYFKIKDINDLLKSMVLRDLDGGNITGVNYSSRDPLTKTLKTFAIDLTVNPGLAGILGQIRGEAVTVALAPQGTDAVSGTIIGVESKVVEAGQTAVFLNLLTAKGIQSIVLSQVKEIRLLNERLEQKLRQALGLLAESHSTDKKRVTLSFAGTGKRRVRVGYLLEAPVWKTSYRLVLGEEESHFLQGWAIVENTTDEDWQNVRLTLVSGRPISFVMDLYRPIYLPRPKVELELYSSLRPQKYEEDLRVAAPERAAPAAPAPSQAADMYAAPSPKPYAEAYAKEEEIDLTQGVQAAARAEQAGEFFRYVIEHPVRLPRQESAMLPIVNQSIEGRRVSIFNERAHSKHPFNGIKFKNTTGLDLMGGPLTVFEAGTYAGDAQINNLPAGAERLISYSLDLNTEVLASGRSLPDLLVSVRIARGSLISTTILRRERVYTIKNSSSRDRRVLVEHPIQTGWELVEPSEPEERTRNHYRFLVLVAAASELGENVKALTVVQERKVDQTVLLYNISNDQIHFFLSASVVGAEVKEALKSLLERRAALNDTIRKRREEEGKRNQIHQEQKRIRENMAYLEKDSSLYKRYLSLLEEQEDELAVILEKIDELVRQEREQRKAFDDYILSLELE